MKFYLLWIVCSILVLFQACGSSPENSYNAAIRYAENRQTQLAEEQFLQATLDSPKNAEAWNQLGIISFERGDWEKAKERFQTAAAIHPLHPVYPRNLALVFAELHEFDTALLLLNKAVELKPDDAENYAAIAKIEWLNQRPADAIKALQKAIMLDPANEEAKHLLSIMQSQ